MQLVDEKPADVVHVQVGKHHVGYGSKIDIRGFQPLYQLPSPRQVQVRVQPKSCIDENSLLAATHHHRIQRPVKCIWRKKHVLHPCRPHSGIGVVPQHLSWER